MRLVIPARQCLHRRKPLNHREEQDLDHVGYVLGRSHCQVGSMLHLYNAKQKVLWDQHKGAEAVTPAVPQGHRTPGRVLHRLVREGTLEMQSGTQCHPNQVVSSGGVTAHNIHCLTPTACHPCQQPRKSHCSEKTWN